MMFLQLGMWRSSEHWTWSNRRTGGAAYGVMRPAMCGHVRFVSREIVDRQRVEIAIVLLDVDDPAGAIEGTGNDRVGSRRGDTDLYLVDVNSD